jgi:hypothetical protein
MEGLSPLGPYAENSYPYPLALLAGGAHLRRRHDISYPAFDFLLTRQNPESGGFYSASGPIGADAEEEMLSTAQAGLTCLLMGNLGAAQHTAAWLQRLWDLQPELPQRLYCRCSSAAGLITDFPPSRAFLYVMEAQGLWQPYFLPGIAAAFLGRLFMATGEEGYLRLARQYQDFSMNATDRQFDSAQVCKSGWGSAVLYEATGEPLYREWTLRLGDWFVEVQLPDGHWEGTKHLAPNPTLRDNIKITAEFVMHLDTIIHAASA